jgi:hypothetical protein
MARKLGQIIARGQNTWLVRIYQGRDPETGTRKYLNQTIHGPFREEQRFLNLKLQQQDLSRTRRAAAITLNQFLDQWLATAARPRLRARTFHDYESLLRLYIRPVPGSWNAPDRHHRADGHAGALRPKVRAGIVSADHRVHERGA